MIKKTIYFGNPAYLSLKNSQLVIKLPEIEQNNDLPTAFKQDSTKTIPIEDIGVVVLDNRQITLTHGLMEKLLDNNCALITCDSKRMPTGMLLPLEGNTTQTERFRCQIEASQPLKKQLWQQTIQAKINNQAHLLHDSTGVIVKNMHKWANDVKSGDSDNLEARAAVYYWANIFPKVAGFTRHKEGIPPNNLLNYGYAILRAIVARALVGSGLLPSLGIHHSNKYNAYCLADDIMEPYRPFVDRLVIQIMQEAPHTNELTKPIKQQLLSIPIIDVKIEDQRRPLMIAIAHTTSSLVQCYTGEARKIRYPQINKC